MDTSVGATNEVTKSFDDLNEEELRTLVVSIKAAKPAQARRLNDQELRQLIEEHLPQTVNPSYTVRTNKKGKTLSVTATVRRQLQGGEDQPESDQEDTPPDPVRSPDESPSYSDTNEIDRWCHDNGLSQDTATKLVKNDFHSLDDLSFINERTVSQLGLTLAQSARLEQLVSKMTNGELVVSSNSNSKSGRQGSGLTTTSELPKIEIPKFNGEVVEWLRFWELFDANINQHPNLKDSTKLHYLQTRLTGQAAQLIQRLPLNDQSYRQAILLLEHRFGDQDKLLRALYHKARHLRPAKYFTAGLRKLVDQWTVIVRSLKGLGEPVERNHQLIESLCCELPASIQTQLELDAMKENVGIPAHYRKPLTE